MDLYAKGQLSFLILNCLLERDFYGLDFISEIYKKSNGRIELKKPSVYSNLTRMEKQGYVSSYLKSSDLGPNRKYYSITEKGRIFYQDLKDYFDRNNIDVFRDFSENGFKTDIKIVNTSSNNLNMFDKDISLLDLNDSTNEPSVNSIDNSLQDKTEESETDSDDYFDFSDVDDSENKKFNSDNDSPLLQKEDETNNGKVVYEDKVNTNTYSIKSLFTSTDINSNKKDEFIDKVNNEDNKIEQASENISNNDFENIENDKKQEEIDKKDDAVFLTSKDVEEYNRRLYDISKDINKYKRKKSFAEDQIAITVDNPTPISESNARTKSNIEEFKNSILENKNKYDTQSSNTDYVKKMSYRFNRETQSYQDMTLENKKKNETDVTLKDDAKFITNRIDGAQLEHAKKIEPPRLKIVNEISNRERDNYKMPPPKRDTSIDPSHKEILSKLYSKTKDSTYEEIRDDALYDYNDLKEFYNGQNISFSVYKKPAEKTEHNTNKIYLIVSLICFFVASIFSVVLYSIFAKTSNLNPNTNFLYILLPALLVIDVCVKFYNYKKYQGWIPNPMLQQWKMWLITFILIALVIGINFICGLNPEAFAEFATTTILLPILIFVAFPFRYYLKRYLLVKYWR